MVLKAFKFLAELRSAARAELPELQAKPPLEAALAQGKPTDCDDEQIFASFTGAADAVRGAGAAAATMLAGCTDEQWARACACAYAIRWLGMPAEQAVSAAGVSDEALREPLMRYFPALLTASLVEAPSANGDGFGYYARAAVAFILNKVEQFGGCEFVFHLNEAAAKQDALLQRMHEAAAGRIAFVEVALKPRPKLAPWLVAAMRLAPLLAHSGRVVAGTARQKRGRASPPWRASAGRAAFPNCTGARATPTAARSRRAARRRRRWTSMTSSSFRMSSSLRWLHGRHPGHMQRRHRLFRGSPMEP